MGRGVEHGPLGAVAVSIGGLIASLTREVADFPEPGIQFKDLTPLLADAHGLDAVSDALAPDLRVGRTIRRVVRFDGVEVEHTDAVAEDADDAEEESSS